MLFRSAQSAYNQANTGTTLAQAAYNYANTIVSDTQVDPVARATANAGFDKANSANVLAQSAFDTANIANTRTISSLANSSYTLVLRSDGQLIVPQSTQGSITAGYVTSLGSIGFNANGNLWKFGEDGTMNSPYSVQITTHGFQWPDGSYQNTAFTGTATDSTARTLAQNAYDYANTVNTYAYSAYAQANTANTKAQGAFDLANTAITTSGGSITGQLNVVYTPATTVGEVLTLSGANTKGGTGFVDVLKLTNTSAGATNPNKYIRLNSTGDIEIVNNTYTSTVVSISDSGVINGTGLQVNGKTATNGPIFSAYQASSQSVPTDVLTKVTFDTEDYDTHGNFSSSRFTPTVEGFYQLSGAVRVDGGIGTGERMIVVYKNGSEYMRAYNSKGTAAVGDSWFQMEINVQVYANGTGDYFEIYMMHGAGANRSLTAARAFTRFQGCMIRGA